MSFGLCVEARLSMPPDAITGVQPEKHSNPLRLALNMADTIKLAATSNYKLAQLTFAPPNCHSLRKLAMVKNTVDLLYQRSPAEWLHPMTRWEFFTPESLESKSQEDLERIIEQYINLRQHGQINLEIGKRRGCNIPPLKINVFNDLARTDKPLPKFPNEEGIVIKSPIRMSWTSDIGAPSSTVQHLAGELMTLFDMEFQVDIELRPTHDAPRLPEAKRLSTDSFMGLIPAFQTFKLDEMEPLPQKTKPIRINFPPPPMAPPPTNATPVRTSSLGYKSIFQNSPTTNPLAHSADPLYGETHSHKAMRPQKSSLRRLASLKWLRPSPPENVSNSLANALASRESRTLSTVSLAPSVMDRSSTSSDVIRVATRSDPYIHLQKNRQLDTLQESNTETRRRSLTTAQPVVMDISELRRASSLGRRGHPVKKRRSLMERTASRRKSAGEVPPPEGRLRKKPSFIQISSKLRTRKSTHRPSAVKEETIACAKQQLAVSDITRTKTTESNTFAKRMVSIGRRMKLQRV